MEKSKQRENTVFVIRILWTSLDSHLDFSIKEDTSCTTCGDRRFQAATVLEYAEAIKRLAETLK